MNNKEKEQSLALADHYFKSNNYPFAEAILKKVIELDPKSSKANELLAYIYGNQGKEELSHNLLLKACSSSEASAEAHYYLGSSFIKLSEFEKAKESLKKALEKAGDFFEGLHDLGSTYARLGNNSKSLKYFLKALKLRNNSYELLFNIGRTYDDLKDFEKAIEYYNHAISINPNHLEALLNKGIAYNQLERFNEALINFDKAIKIKHDYPEAWLNKGLTLNNLNLNEEALQHFDVAIKLRANYKEAWSNKACTLSTLRRYKEALNHHDKAIEISPSYAEAWANKGITLQNLRQFDDAFSHYDKALELNSNLNEARNNKALLNLYLKKFSSGWKDHHARFEIKPTPPPLSPDTCSYWNIEKKFNHLLIFSEQGIGDQVFYASFLQKVIDKGTKITVLTDKRLIPIFARSFPKITFLEKNSPINSRCFDAQIPIGNLPAILNFDPSKNYNKQKPFLLDNQEITKKLEQTSLFKNAFTCGVAWKSSNKKIGADKSINLSALKKILKTPNCKFINLQYGEVDEDIKYANELNGVEISSVKNIDLFENIDGLLSIIKACDIVITTSNVTAHLSGSIGKKTLLLTPYSQGKIWYWHDESVSTWYPSIHQFSQDRNLDWDEAINNVAKELKKEINGKN